MSDASIESTLTAVSSLVSDAERSTVALARHDQGGGDDWIHSLSISTRVDTAFTQLLMLTDSLGLNRTYEQIQNSYNEALKREDGLSAFATDPDGDVHLHAADSLRRFVSSLEAVYGLSSYHIVRKDVIQVLRGTQYAITDPNCFPDPPASEGDVHHRVEAVLKCIFPDLRHTPPIPKAVKHFKPDTGLPSVRTLIEYKFLHDKADFGRIADEILADTRGYTSREWSSFIFLIYETRRLKPEREWNDLLRECGTALNTQAIVICGEAPRAKAKRAKAASTNSRTKRSQRQKPNS